MVHEFWEAHSFHRVPKVLLWSSAECVSLVTPLRVQRTIEYAQIA